jgi:hypothetical protein
MATLQRRNQDGQTRAKTGDHECSDLVPRPRGAGGPLERLSKVTDPSPADPPFHIAVRRIEPKLPATRPVAQGRSLREPYVGDGAIRPEMHNPPTAPHLTHRR